MSLHKGTKPLSDQGTDTVLSGKKVEASTPTKAPTSHPNSPYSPSRQKIPPLPVPENMDVQLKPTIPNSKRKFDINRLAFAGDQSGESLDELKSMLESIQDALVNIVQRSKGNSSNIINLTDQLKVFNETFKARQRNEDDLLTTTVFKSNLDSIFDLVLDLHKRIGDPKEPKGPADVNQSTPDTFDELKQKDDQILEKLTTLLERQSGSQAAQELESAVSEIQNSIQTAFGNLEKSIGDGKADTDTAKLVSQQKHIVDILSTKNAQDDDKLAEQLQQVESNIKTKLNQLEEKFQIDNLEKDLAKLSLAQENMLTNTDKNNELEKVFGQLEAVKSQLGTLEQSLEKSLSKEADDELVSKIHDQIHTFHGDMDVALAKTRLDLLEDNGLLKHKVQDLAELVARNDSKIQELESQLAAKDAEAKEAHYQEIKIAELMAQLKSYEEKQIMQQSHSEIMAQTVSLSSELARMETTVDHKKQALAELDEVYSSKLAKFAQLSAKFDELKAKTSFFLAERPEQTLVNNARFDLSQGQHQISLSASSSSDGSAGSPLKTTKRNITMNEKMLLSARNLSEMDSNSAVWNYGNGTKPRAEHGAPGPNDKENRI